MKLRILLLAGAAAVSLLGEARADDAAILKRLDDMQRMIDAQQNQIKAQRSEIADLKKALSGKAATKSTAATPAAQDAIARQDAKIGDLAAKFESAQQALRVRHEEEPHWSFANSRPTIQSTDGRFSLALRLLAQFDAAYYAQDASARLLAAANGPDLSSGTNFRRAQIGFQGKLFGDWSYLFNTEFGGSGGTEGAGRVQSLFLEYDGLKNFAFRVGAFPPPAGLEDNIASSDTIFLERAAPSDILRNAVGGDGRDSLTATYNDGNWYAALSLTGAKVADSANFDDQEALLGRVADTIYSNADSRIVLSASGAWLFKGPDSTALPNSPRLVTLSAAPEITVDSNGTKLVSTGALDTQSLVIWGAEAGAQWQNLFAQAGYFDYRIDRRNSALSDLNFDGWYAEATWVLTGEPRGYSTANAAFASPKPRAEFSLTGGGWGAWELAARYSDVDLNDNAGTIGLALPLGGVRGGEQRIWTIGVNWYPNPVLRLTADWQNVDIARIGTLPGPPAVANADVGQQFDIFSFRSQFSL